MQIHLAAYSHLRTISQPTIMTKAPLRTISRSGNFGKGSLELWLNAVDSYPTHYQDRNLGGRARTGTAMTYLEIGHATGRRTMLALEFRSLTVGESACFLSRSPAW